MNTLITPTEALRRAFRSDERLAADSFTEADVAVAEQRFLRPMLGASLHDRLLAGGNTRFVEEYLAAPLAFLTRLVAQPRLALLASPVGLLMAETATTEAAKTEARHALMRELRMQAKTLLKRAAEYLDTHKNEFPEYDPDQNVFNRCMTDGGFVQII